MRCIFIISGLFVLQETGSMPTFKINVQTKYRISSSIQDLELQQRQLPTT